VEAYGIDIDNVTQALIVYLEAAFILCESNLAISAS